MNKLYRALVLLLVAVVTPGPAHLFAQELSSGQLEETVRNTYGALSFVCGLGRVVRHAQVEHFGAGDADRPLSGRHELHGAVPVFTITGMQTGTIASIGQRKYKEFFDIPTGPILKTDISHQSHTENSVKSEWRQCEADWKDIQLPSGLTEDNTIMGWTVQKVAEMGSTEFSVPATYTQYAAFTVTTTLGDITIGPYKVIFFFGRDKQGNLIVAPEDLANGGQALWTVLKEQLYPDQLLTSVLRETPAIVGWAKSNTLADSSCSAMRSDLCCHDGRCGLPESKVDRDLALPLSTNR